MPAAELGRVAFLTKKLLNNLPLKLYAETSLVSHGKVLPAPIIGHLTLPNLPNLKCPVSGVHSTTTALVLRLLSDHRKITMAQLVEHLVNREWEKDKGKALNATSMTRFRKKLHKILRRIIW